MIFPAPPVPEGMPVQAAWLWYWDMLEMFGLSIIAILTLIAFGIVIFWQTPAMTYLSAKLKGKTFIYNPTAGGSLKRHVANSVSRFAYVKKGKQTVWFATNPEDRYYDDGVPSFINYDRFAFSLKPQVAVIAKYLHNIGIRNWTDLQEYMKGMEEHGVEEVDEKGDVIKDEEGKVKVRKYTPNELTLNVQGIQMTWQQIADMFDAADGFDPSKPFMEQTLKIGGESIDFDNIDMMFSENQRGDIIEAEIQRRGAAEAAQRMGKGSDWVKLGFAAAIIMMIVMIAFTVAMTGLANCGGLTATAQSVPGASGALIR